MEIHTPKFDLNDDQELSENFIQDATRLSRLAQENWIRQTVAAVEIASNVDPYESDLPLGSVIPAVSALGWRSGFKNCDIRPRLFDKASGEHRLIDSGSMISVTKKQPGDKIDESIKLVAVNGTKIHS